MGITVRGNVHETSNCRRNGDCSRRLVCRRFCLCRANRHCGSSIASEIQPLVSNVGWENVCRDRSVLRRDRNGNVIRLLVPMCNMVWIGQRYFYRGNYYADPNFVAQIY